MNTFYHVYYPIPLRSGGFIWYPYKSYKTKAYAAKVMSSKLSCFAIARNPYPFCDDSEKIVYIYGNYRAYFGLTLEHFQNFKRVVFV